MFADFMCRRFSCIRHECIVVDGCFEIADNLLDVYVQAGFCGGDIGSVLLDLIIES